MNTAIYQYFDRASWALHNATNDALQAGVTDHVWNLSESINSMSEIPEYHFADVEGLRLMAFVSQKYGRWSAAVYDLKEKRYRWEHEPLLPEQNSQESAKGEALLRAAVILSTSTDELNPSWTRSEPSPRYDPTTG